MTDEQKAIESRIGPTMTLRALAVAMNENAGYLSQVRRGKRRASNRLRVKLGLAPHAVPVTPCLHCGTVPLKRRCGCRSRPRSAVRRDWRRSFAWLASLWAAGKL